MEKSGEAKQEEQRGDIFWESGEGGPFFGSRKRTHFLREKVKVIDHFRDLYYYYSML